MRPKRRRKAITECMEKLRAADKELIIRRYGQGVSNARRGRSVATQRAGHPSLAAKDSRGLGGMRAQNACAGGA